MPVTIKDIGRAANVSIATVSKVLNGDYSKVSEQTRDRVLRIASEMEYRPNRLARGLASCRFDMIGVVTPDISNPYFASLVRAITDECEKYGYKTMISNSDSRRDREMDNIFSMAEYNSCGILLAGSVLNDNEDLAAIARTRLPCVTVENQRPNVRYSVYVDGYSGAFEAVSYLIACGHRAIAYICGNPRETAATDVRLLGYKGALEKNGLPLEEQRVEYGSYSIESGEAATVRLLRKGIALTAIACGNDMIALGAFRALRDNGLRVPQDVSIIGFDDVALSGVVEPRLTTVHQPVREMGACAVNMLIGIIRQKPPAQNIQRFSPTLVKRDTVRVLENLPVGT